MGERRRAEGRFPAQTTRSKNGVTAPTQAAARLGLTRRSAEIFQASLIL